MHQDAECQLPKSAAHHVVDVLRLKPGAALELFNGDGYHYQATLQSADKRASVLITDAQKSTCESPLKICLWQGLSRGERMDASVRQAVELGASEIRPIETARCQVKLDAKRASKRHVHWSSIIESAAEQSGRARIPTLATLTSLREAMAARDKTRIGIVMAPAAERALGQFSPTLPLQHIDVLIGPESGLSDEEIAQAVNSGFTPLSAGRRILRTETAGPATLAILQARFGDLR